MKKRGEKKFFEGGERGQMTRKWPRVKELEGCGEDGGDGDKEKEEEENEEESK